MPFRGQTNNLVDSTSHARQISMTDEEKLQELLALTRANGEPNINVLWRIAKDLEAIKLNIKFFGYELAKRLAEALPPPDQRGFRPIDLHCKPSTQADLEADWSRHWSGQLKIAHVFHRKVWEFAYVLQALKQLGCLRPGAKGLGFGCGEEPLPSYLAGQGCAVTMTELPPDDERAQLWAATGQHGTLETAFYPELVDRARYDSLMDFRFVNMNAIPADLHGYDFCWSVCAFEHLGSIRQGIDFIVNSMATLKAGGVSVHTTEFNFMNDEETIDNWSTVLYQRRHFEEMADRLRAEGHRVLPLDFDVGSKPLDKFIDIPPYNHDWKFDQADKWRGGNEHMKLEIDGFAVTCFGLVAIKDGLRAGP